MQNHKNQESQGPADDFLKELKRCENIFKTKPCVEILAPIENRKSSVDDVKFKRITTGILRQTALMEKMENKLTELGKSMQLARDLVEDINLKYDISR